MLALVPAALVSVAAATGQPGEPGQPGQPGQPGRPGTSSSVVSVGSAGAPGSASVVQISGQTLQVTQSSAGVARIQASCSGGTAHVDFGDGTSADVPPSSGPITHTFASGGTHRVSITCSSGGSAGAAATKSGCLRIPAGVLPDAIARFLLQLGVDVCRR